MKPILVSRLILDIPLSWELLERKANVSCTERCYGLDCLFFFFCLFLWVFCLFVIFIIIFFLLLLFCCFFLVSSSEILTYFGKEEKLEVTKHNFIRSCKMEC